jgi:hypothetical protein
LRELTPLASWDGRRSRQGTTWADLTIRQTIRANEENRTEDDADYNVRRAPLPLLGRSLTCFPPRNSASGYSLSSG